MLMSPGFVYSRCIRFTIILPMSVCHCTSTASGLLWKYKPTNKTPTNSHSPSTHIKHTELFDIRCTNPNRINRLCGSILMFPFFSLPGYDELRRQMDQLRGDVHKLRSEKHDLLRQQGVSSRGLDLLRSTWY